ncbi:MAG: DNA polymerase III subunit gamma/tau, partial [Acutalibacteraceae bacterium]
MYKALYRKYRPQLFADVVGQPQVTVTLKNELMAGRISHAYLFTGSRGTGKTTCAKILAKAVNCLDPQDGDPCGACPVCRGLDDGSILDVVEIDAASNNGVDSIRALIEESNFTPANAKYRVYIIDEVHMLSVAAFNALLKTLEEPPAHVIFILATTEVHKLLPTILSRCQRFDFRRIAPEDIAERLELVCEKEHVEIDRDAAMLIAVTADGGMRDALSILDQCIGRSTGTVSYALVAETAGLAGRGHLESLAQCIHEHDRSGALEKIDVLYKGSK